jgi:preprotein translocase subunit SecE
MANKDRNKRSVRQARQRERVEHEALVAQSQANDKGAKKKVAVSQASKAPTKVSTDQNPGFFGRAKNYLSEVRAEMRRVTWPSRSELTNYSVAVTVMLIVFGFAVWMVDTGFVAALVAFTNLRG